MFWLKAKAFVEEGKPTIVLPDRGRLSHIETYSNRCRQVVVTITSQYRLLPDIAASARKLGINKIVLFASEYPTEVREHVLSEVDQLPARVLMNNSEGAIVPLVPSSESS